MASPFAEAIMASMTAKLDPNNAMVSQYMGTMTAEAAVDLQVKKAQAVGQIEALVTAAVERKADVSVIEAYQKILAKLNA